MKLKHATKWFTVLPMIDANPIFLTAQDNKANSNDYTIRGK